MPNIEYYANNELRRINIQPLDKLIAAASPKPSRGISRLTATMASQAVQGRQESGQAFNADLS